MGLGTWRSPPTIGSEAAGEWRSVKSAPLDGTTVEVAIVTDGDVVIPVYGFFGRYVDDEGDGWTDGTVASWDYQHNARYKPIAWRERRVLNAALAKAPPSHPFG